jgi:hypothetical protein
MNTTSRPTATRDHFRMLLLTLIWMAARPVAPAAEVTPANSQLILLPWPNPSASNPVKCASMLDPGS